jgi:hypothetical protein
MLILFSFLFTLLNYNCGVLATEVNGTANQSELEFQWTDIVVNTKCEDLPAWYQWVVYTPILIIGGKAFLTLA